MRREGCDEDNLAMEDFLCDFCGNVWTDDRPMVEGHHGSCVCGHCLTVAYVELGLTTRGGDSGGSEGIPAGTKCNLCLEVREESMWSSPMREAYLCKRCTKQSAGVLQKDKDIPWTKPVSVEAE